MAVMITGDLEVHESRVKLVVEYNKHSLTAYFLNPVFHSLLHVFDCIFVVHHVMHMLSLFVLPPRKHLPGVTGRCRVLHLTHLVRSYHLRHVAFTLLPERTKKVPVFIRAFCTCYIVWARSLPTFIRRIVLSR